MAKCFLKSTTALSFYSDLSELQNLPVALKNGSVLKSRYYSVNIFQASNNAT